MIRAVPRWPGLWRLLAVLVALIGAAVAGSLPLQEGGAVALWLAACSSPGRSGTAWEIHKRLGIWGKAWAFWCLERQGVS